MLLNEARCILGVQLCASKDDIRKAYKDTALSCHPDKLAHITDDNEKTERIEKFKKATTAYETLVKHSNEDDGDLGDLGDWGENLEDWEEFFANLTNMFKTPPPRPQTTKEYERIIHNIRLDVTYVEILKNSKKKLRLILKDVEEPIFLDVLCGSFPTVVREYTIDREEAECTERTEGPEGLDHEDHDIVINMNIKEFVGYDHIIHDSGMIDLITTVHLKLSEYILGCTKKIVYVDGSELEVHLPAFQKEFYEIPEKGLKKGSLILNISVKAIEKDVWDSLEEKSKAEMIRILGLL